MIQFSGGTIYDQTFVSNGTRRDLIDHWETAIVAAGWSVVSGGGSADKVYDSAPTPDGNFRVRVRGRDPGSGNCAIFTLKDNGTLETPSSFLLPVSGQIYRIWANRYQFFLCRSGTDMTLQRSVFSAGVPWLPAFMVDWMQSFPYIGWSQRVGSSDVDTTTMASSWRVIATGTGAAGYWIWRGSASSSFAIPLIGPSFPTNAAMSVYSIWDDGSFQLNAPLFWFLGSNTIRGQMWDAMLSTKNYDSETVRNIGGKPWRNYTHQAGIGTQGSLLLLTN
jgi:hypothetical protein